MFNSVFCAIGNGWWWSRRCTRAPGKVTLVYFWAAWCGPCRAVTPALEKMAATDADIALRKIDLTSPDEAYNVTAIPYVKVYNRSGSLVGSVTGSDVDKIKSYVTQAKGG